MESDFTPELIIKAYSAGVFPMGDKDSIHWYSPDPRCVIDIKQFHVPERLKRTYKQGRLQIKVDCNWDKVIRECAGRESTWITEKIIFAYTKLYQLGLAHSVEAYEKEELVGGLYGVSLRGAFMGESMFHTRTNASKICLVFLVERLAQRGYLLLDCQYMTKHIATFGAQHISRAEYLVRLNEALQLDCQFN